MAPSTVFSYCFIPLVALVGKCLAIPTLSQSPPSDAVSLSPYLNSFSIEFKDFPLFAGNRTNPNQFSINLLSNLASRTGVMPMIRVGGTTQDDAIFIPSQTEPVITIGVTNGDARAGVTIGPSFFTSYGTFPATKYIPGINLATNGTNGTETRQNEVEYIYKALGRAIELFEIGNEPDLFKMWERRSSSWNVTDYVAEWQTANQLADEVLSKLHASGIAYFAPSFAGTDVGSSLDSMAPLAAFAHGIDVKNNIKQLSGHNYMGSATGSGVTLQSTLMNHTSVVHSIANHVTLAQELRQYSSAPYIMGETNSLSGGGAAGLSNVFGAALWVVDYTLYQATQNITRVHFHQSGTSPYSAWAPSTVPPTTNAPYYGNVMVAAAVGAAPHSTIAYIDMGSVDGTVSGYGVYENGQLRRVVVLNMKEWRSDSGTARPSSSFSVNVPRGVQGAKVERLTAPGAEVLSGVTFGGVSYDYDLKEGKPVVVDAGAAKEAVVGKKGVLSVVLNDSEGVVLHLY